jgi:type I restriction enzyme S subunit
MLPAFLNWLSKTQSFIDICKAASVGTTNRIRLKEEKFLTMKLPLPSLTEQQRIVARIEELATKIAEARGLRQEASKEVELFAASISALMFDAAAKRGEKRLDEVAYLARGKFSHRPRNEARFFGGKHAWIQIGEIESSNKFIRRWRHTLNDEGLAISRKFPKGTLLISIAATIGAIGILEFDCCVPDSIVAVTPKSGFDSEYLYYYLGYARKHLEQIAPQTAQKNINLKILSLLPVPALSLDEQRQIVDYLNHQQSKIDSLKQLQAQTAAELDAMLPAVLDKAFKGEL